MDTTTSTLARLDQPGRTIVGGAAAVVIGALLGIALGAWSVQPFALVMVALALVAGVAVAAPALTGSMAAVEPHRSTIARIAAIVAVVLASFALVEMVADLDDLEDYGGILGVATAIVVAAGSVAMLMGSMRGSMPMTRSTDRGARVALVGAGLVLVAWVLHLTVGFWSFGPAVWSLAAIVLAAAILAIGSTDVRMSVRLGWVAAGLGAFTAFTALGQWSELMRLGETRLELGPTDILPFLVYTTGIVLVIAGGVLRATGGRLAMPTATLAGDGASS